MISFISLGANLPVPMHQSPLATCRQALQALACLPKLQLAAMSEWYETAPHPPSDQPSYVNGVAQMAGIIDPVWLLQQLQAIEHRFGRRRGAPNAARTLDLDIIAIDSLVRQTADPLLPHPRMHERAFVLAPMSDIAPEWRHPILQRSVAELLNTLPLNDVRKIR